MFKINEQEDYFWSQDRNGFEAVTGFGPGDFHVRDEYISVTRRLIRVTGFIPKFGAFEQKVTAQVELALQPSNPEPFDLSKLEGIKSISFGRTFGVFFKPDGTKLYRTMNSTGGGFPLGNIVVQYSLSTPWDLATLSYNDKFFAIAQDGGAVRDKHVAFNPDGTKMYIAGRWGSLQKSRIYSYTLSPAWNVDSAVWDGFFTSLLHSGGEITAKSLTFSFDGKEIYVGGRDGKIFQFSLPVPWDVAVLNDNGKFLVVSGTYAEDVIFLPGGVTAYVITSEQNEEVFQYTLSTPWDISTATNVSSGFYQETAIDVWSKDLVFRPDGCRLYITSGGAENATITQVTQLGLCSTEPPPSSSEEWQIVRGTYKFSAEEVTETE